MQVIQTWPTMQYIHYHSVQCKDSDVYHTYDLSIFFIFSAATCMRLSDMCHLMTLEFLGESLELGMFFCD